MAVGTSLSRVTGFGRILALSYAIGQQGLSDTYLIANNAPNIIYELVVGGVLAATVVPIFVKRFATESEDDAWRAVSAVLTTAMLAVFALTALVFVAAPWIIHLYTLHAPHEVRADEREVGTFLLRLFAPQVAIYGFISVATGLLNAKRTFAPPMFAPILNNLVVIFVLLSLPSLTSSLTLSDIKNDTTGLLFLGLGTTAGVVAMGLVLVPYLRSTAQGRLRLTWEPRHEAVRTMIRMSAWTFGFVIANQIAWWVMTVLAANDEGGFAALFTAYNFFILPHAIVAVSIMSALQPELAERWSLGEIDRFRSQLVLGLRTVAFLMIPAGVGYALLAHPIMSVVLEHGVLSSSDANTTANTLIFMALGLPGFSAFLYVTRVFQATQDARSVFFLYLFENAVNVVTAFAFYQSMGVKGLALSQTIAYTSAAAVGVAALRRRARGIAGRQLVRSFAAMSLATALMALSLFGVSELFTNHDVLKMLIGVIVGAAVYLGMSLVLKAPELRALQQRFRPARTDQ